MKIRIPSVADLDSASGIDLARDATEVPQR
jgi:hypothetical protein